VLLFSLPKNKEEYLQEVKIMKKLGLIGGIGPESTLDYYKGIIDGYRKRTGGDDYPVMVIDSLNLTEMYNLASKKDWKPFTDILVESTTRLVAAGAELAAMAANTAHIVFDEVKKRSPLPLVSIIEETCHYALSKKCKRVVIFGTAFTMSSGLYTEAFARYGMEAFVPTGKDQKTIHNIIFPHLQEGIVIPEEKKAVLEIARRMISDKRADALVLGCTELPLLIREGDLELPLLDTTQIHIQKIVELISA